MHARLVRLKGDPEGAKQRLARFEDKAVPVIRGQAGFRRVARRPPHAATGWPPSRGWRC